MVRLRFHTLLSLPVCFLLAVFASDAAANTVAPLPQSDYTVRHACARPYPGHAGCLALRLVPQTTAARTHTHPLGISRTVATGAVHPLSAAEGGDGLRPLDLRDAYFPSEPPEAPASEPQTIALVDAYNDPSIEADLAVYDSEFGLPSCASANGCLAVVNQKGESDPLPFPATKSELESARKSLNKKRREEAEEAGGWAVEISTDVQMARAICQNHCRIVLVEAETPSYEDLEAAEEAAVKLSATEISNSWGGGEPGADASAFNHPGVVITASSGDDGYRNWTEAAEAGAGNYYAGANYPASSPHVVAVGGTKLTLAGGGRENETVWNEDPDGKGENHGAGGGGCSEFFAAASWQSQVPHWSAVGCGTSRAVADIAADADPYTGVAVYDSTPDEAGAVLHWVPIGGTSVASPIVASMFALGGGAHGVAYPAQTLYSQLGTSSLYDVTSGGNAECHDEYASCSASSNPLLDCGSGTLICNAASGYDGPTGVGAPNGLGAFEPSEAPTEPGEEEVEAAKEEPPKEEAPKEEVKPEELGPKGEGGSGSGGETEEGTDELPGNGSLEIRGTISPPRSIASPTKISSAPGSKTAQISALTLTANARAALRRRGHGFADVAFSFKLTTRVRVRAAIAVRVGPPSHRRWQAVRASRTFVAIEGLNRRRLPVARALTAGLYRLTLTPLPGVAQSITVRVP